MNWRRKGPLAGILRMLSPRYILHPAPQRVSVRLSEWDELLPASSGAGSVLAGLSFGADTQARARASELSKAGVVSVTERLDGLAVETWSFVGRLAIGPLDLTIIPKISWGRWLTLIGYALRLRGLVRAEHLNIQVAAVPLHDVIILELVAEARDLLARGLHREYVRRRARLTTPRGRIDFAHIGRNGGIVEPSVMCRFTRRSDDSPLNQALQAGLRFAARRADDRGLRADARKLAQELERTVGAGLLSVELLRSAGAALDRRTRRYEAALRLIHLLIEGEAVTLEDDLGQQRVTLPGFALDMNRIWQQLLARVLLEWSDGVEVREEFALRGVFQQNPDYPLRRRVPTPRPDFAAFVKGHLIAFLDAKYRDLWERPLPREMLYQLSLYAMAQGGGAAAILYPSDSAQAIEQRLDIRNPLSPVIHASVALRPVPLATLEALITAPATAGRSERRRAFARALVSA
jgi:5-methylcytosine-specific restriction enzyme subunit McrC